MYGLQPYLLTVTGDGRPHAVAVTVRWEGDSLAMAVGRRTAANATERPDVTLLWPPPERGGYSLIVDGGAKADAEGHLHVVPSAAVLHRPAPPDEGGGSGAGCGSDCVPISGR